MKILLIGGPRDGQWHEVEEDSLEPIRFPRPFDISKALEPDNDILDVGLAFDSYYQERYPIGVMGLTADMRVAFHSELRYGPDRAMSLVKAMFQRDVAALFKEW